MICYFTSISVGMQEFFYDRNEKSYGGWETGFWKNCTQGVDGCSQIRDGAVGGRFVRNCGMPATGRHFIRRFAALCNTAPTVWVERHAGRSLRKVSVGGVGADIIRPRDGKPVPYGENPSVACGDTSACGARQPLRLAKQACVLPTAAHTAPGLHLPPAAPRLVAPARGRL